MIYTSSGNVPYVQSGSVGDFIPEPRCSKSVVGLQTRRRKEGVYKRFSWLQPEGSRSELGGIQEVRMAPTGRVAVGTWWSCGCKGLMLF